MSRKRFTYKGKLFKYILLKIRYLGKAKPWGKEKLIVISKYIICRKRTIIIAILLIIISVNVSLGYWYYKANLVTLYHVYVDGERIGTVNNKDIIYIWKSQYLIKAQAVYGPVNLDSKNSIKFIKEIKYKGSYDNYQAIDILVDRIEIEAKGLSIYVDGKFIGVVKDQFTYESLINDLKESYVPRDYKRRITVSTITDTNQQPLELLNVSIKEKITTVETKTAPENILNEEDLTKILMQESIEEIIYTVKNGETASDIVDLFDMNIEELYNLNPTIRNNGVLDELELVVIEKKPFLTIQSEERLVQFERVPYKVVYENDDSMYINESKVLIEGKEGKIEVEYSLFKENGVLQEVKIIGKKGIEEPQEKIILKGTKEIPTRGSGVLSWPTNGGIITSFYGQRWGSHHNGIDISGVSDFNIMAADNGTVIYTGWKSGYGKIVIIDHGNGTETLYAHLSTINVNIGDIVAKGQKIGAMGSTGRTTGIHLHFEVKVDGFSKNPLNYVGI